MKTVWSLSFQDLLIIYWLKSLLKHSLDNSCYLILLSSFTCTLITYHPHLLSSFTCTLITCHPHLLSSFSCTLITCHPHLLSSFTCTLITRVFSEVPFWNSAEYGILYGIGFISRNSAKFFTVQFRVGSCIRNSVYLQMKIHILSWFHIYLFGFIFVELLEFKGTVRQDARWVENGLKRCILTNYMTASLPFLFLKRHHHEKGLKPVSAS